MNEFIKLKELVSSLGQQEIKISKKYFRKSGESDFESLGSTVLYFLCDEQNLDENKLMHKLYGGNNFTAFKKLLQRIYAKLLDLLISNEMLIESYDFNERTMSIAIIKKRFFYYDVLSLHGLNEQAISMLDQIIKLCKEIELYEYLLIALNKKMLRISRRTGVNKIIKVLAEIEIYSEIQLNLCRAEYLICLFSTSNIDGNFENFKKIDLGSEISRIDIVLKKSKSVRLQLFLYQIQGLEYSLNKQYELAKRNYKKMNSFLNKADKIIIKPNDTLNCLFNIVEFEMKTFHFGAANSRLGEIEKIVIKNKFNKLLLKELLFLNNWYLGNISQLQSSFVKINFETSNFESTLLFKDKFSFYQSLSYFIAGESANSFKSLQLIEKINKKKDDWNVNIRLLMIFNLINLEKYILASNYIESLRKYIAKAKFSKKELNTYKTILNLLNLLDKSGYDFKKVKNDSIELLNFVDANSSNMLFDHRSPFLLPFTPWFISKANNVPYNHKAAMKNIVDSIKMEQLEVA